MSEHHLNSTLQTGHVLFIEIVELSALPLDSQNQALGKLQDAISNSEEVRGLSTPAESIKLATGNGMAVVFFDDATAPLKCALAIARLWPPPSGLKLRMGIHSGLVYRVHEIRGSLASEGISQSEKVASCGDPGHILVSKSAAIVLRSRSEWARNFHEVGETEIEPGINVPLFNFYMGELGNPNVPTIFRSGQQPGAGPPRLVDGRYRLLEKLGEGGMGLVYVAEDTRLDRRVALKLLITGHHNDHYRDRFYREARAASRLNHPYIATIYDYGITADGPFIVMELVRGKTLASLLKDGPLSIPRAVEIVSDVAEALGEAHRRGIIHRDIKPANVGISGSGKVKVLDFGLAKEIQPTDAEVLTGGEPAPSGYTLSGVIIGTPLYLSPEQARGATVDARSDIFALGSLLYECLTGVAAFAGTSTMEVCTNVIHINPPPPSKFNPRVTAELDRINLKALAKEPQARYQSAEELLGELRDVQATMSKGDAMSTKILSPAIDSLSNRSVSSVNQDWRSRSLTAVLMLLVIGLIGWTADRYWPRGLKNGGRGPEKFWYDRGTQSLRDGAFFQASKMLEESVKINNAFALAHARLAEAYMELDVTDRARQEMLRAEEGRESLGDLDQLHLNAIKATVQRDFGRAVEAYQSLQQRSPVQQSIDVDLGRAYEKNYEFDKAIESYEKATRLDAPDAAAFLHLGSLYGRKRDAEKALGSFDKAESMYIGTSNSEGQAEVLYQRGSFFNQISKFKDARTNLEKSLNIVRENKYQQVRILLQLSLLECFAGEPEKSQQLGGDAVEMARANTFDVLTAQALLGFGIAYQCAGRNAEAEKYFEEGRILARRHEALSTEAKAYLSLASMKIGQSKTDEVLQNVKSALAIYQKLGGYSEELGSAKAIMGRVWQQKGEYKAALDAFADLLSRAEASKDTDHIALAHEGLGMVMLLQERYPEALVELEASLKTNESKSDQLGIGFASSNYGNVLWRLGRYDDAERMFNRARSIGKGYKNMLLEVQVNRLEEALSRRDFSLVVRTAADILNLVDPKDLSPVIKAKTGSALAKLNAGRLAEAKKLCDEAVAQAIDLGDPALIYSARADLAEVLLESQDAARALEIVSTDLNQLVNKNQQESLWRGYVLAARASQQLNDESNARRYAVQAREVLNRIESAWGAEVYGLYIKRPDVAFLLGQLKKLPA